MCVCVCVCVCLCDHLKLSILYNQHHSLEEGLRQSVTVSLLPVECQSVTISLRLIVAYI